MNKRYWVLTALLLPVLFGGWWGYELWTDLRVAYVLGQQTLTGEGRTYVAESNLALQPVEVGERIGHAEDGFWIWEVEGQEQRDWVVVSGFMFPHTLYRAEEVPEVDLAQVKWDGLLLQDSQGLQKKIASSDDPSLALEAIKTAQSGAAKSGATQDERSKSFLLRVLSSELPGLCQEMYVTVQADGDVYLHRSDIVTPLQMTSPLEKWIKTALEIE
ncbi:hypothetical protein EV586_102751 [Tumebacillus sp. BK434]|uniref:hypothetical protein n=1 Tax=Tumebacillus sp. BK434 TaxID=2512169 RepID=UPI001044B87A|nr:hypothetical protein [Tumebacillus sp. BK434]TCP58297.1 hypothetical protein EV586_102751 [Tumebacillus sp. BK434]